EEHRKMRAGLAKLSRTPEAPAPRRREEDVRRQSEDDAQEPDRLGVLPQDDRALGRGISQRRGARIDDAVVGLVEVTRSERRPACGDLRGLAERRDER